MPKYYKRDESTAVGEVEEMVGRLSNSIVVSYCSENLAAGAGDG
jgi:hypothetical protein